MISKNVTVRVKSIWFALWIFTVGLCRLDFWQGFWALVIWPYYIGDFLRNLL